MHMDSFDKKIKNAFEQTNDVPNDFNWESMESGIISKMQRVVPTPSINTSLINLKWLGIIGVTAIMGALILYFNSYNSNTATHITKVTSKNNASENIITLKNISNSSINTNKNIDPKHVDIQATSKNQYTSVDLNTSSTTTIVEKIQNPKQVSKITQKFDSNNSIINSISDTYTSSKSHTASRVNKLYESGYFKESRINSDLSSGETSNLSDPLIIDKTTIQLDNQQYIARNSDKNLNTATQISKDNRFIESVNNLPNQVHIISINMSDNTGINKKPKAYRATSIEKNRNPLQFALELNSGINMWSSEYQNAVVLNEYSKKQFGYYSSINAMLITKSWDYIIGYQYEYLNELLNYNKITQEPVEFSDIVIGTINNSYSNSSSEIIGDTTVIRDRTRKIVNYNTISSHQLRLGVTRKLHIGNKLQWGINLGGSYTFYSVADGVSLDNQEQYRFYNNSISSSFGIFTGVELQYMLGSKLSFISNLSYRQTIGEWSIDQFKIRNPGVINLGVGLRYLL